MKDNLSIIISMIIFVILIVIFPLYNYFERQDDMSYNLANKATTNFVDEVTEAGYLDQDMYNRFVDELSSTGNVYDIQLEAHKKIRTSNDGGTTYDEQYLIDYNNQIFSGTGGDISSNLNERTIKDNAYYLNEGDQFYVKLKNSNTTMAGAIFNTIVPASSKDRIVVNYGGIVKNEAWAKVDATYNALLNLTNSPTVYINGTVVTKGSTYSGTILKNSIVKIKGEYSGATSFNYAIVKDGIQVDSSNNIASGTEYSYKFTESGNYQVTVWAAAPASSRSSTVYIKIGDSIEGSSLDITSKSEDDKNEDLVSHGAGTVTYVRTNSFNIPLDVDINCNINFIVPKETAYISNDNLLVVALIKNKNTGSITHKEVKKLSANKAKNKYEISGGYKNNTNNIEYKVYGNNNKIYLKLEYELNFKIETSDLGANETFVGCYIRYADSYYQKGTSAHYRFFYDEEELKKFRELSYVDNLRGDLINHKYYGFIEDYEITVK